MKSRTIEIIDNHIKALEEELEWYQEKNREWQEKCERLREQLRWHSVDELPECGKGKSVWSVDVLLDAHVNYFPVVAYYSYWSKSWINSDTGSNINVKNGDKWCYIPEDNQGTDCTQEGE